MEIFMKKMILTCCLLALLAVICGAYLETHIIPYSSLRTASTGDDTALDGTTSSYTYKFTDKPATAVNLNTRFNGAQIIFYGTDANNEDCDYIIYAYRDSGPAEKVCSGTVTLGTAVTGATNTFYADTITCTDVWPTTVTVANSAADGVATLSFDLMGHEWVFVQFADAGETCATMSAMIAGY